MQYKTLFSGLIALSCLTGYIGIPMALNPATAQAAETPESEVSEDASDDAAATETPEAADTETAEETEAPDAESSDATAPSAPQPTTAPSNPAVLKQAPEAIIPNNTAPATAAPQDKGVIQSKTTIEWVPLARVNPSKPVTIVLNNQTNETMEYLITTHTNFRTLAPGQQASLIVTNLPSFVNINATRSVGVKYFLKVKDNTITADLKLTPGQGDTTLNIHEQGAIYLY